MMARKTDEERLQDLQKKMEQIEAKKQQLATRLKEKKRKERTKRLIETGAIFEKYFEIESVEDSEKIAKALQKTVLENKHKILRKNSEQNEEKISD